MRAVSANPFYLQLTLINWHPCYSSSADLVHSALFFRRLSGNCFWGQRWRAILLCCRGSLGWSWLGLAGRSTTRISRAARPAWSGLMGLLGSFWRRSREQASLMVCLTPFCHRLIWLALTTRHALLRSSSHWFHKWAWRWLVSYCCLSRSSRSNPGNAE